jgi:hypothetical protein
VPVAPVVTVVVKDTEAPNVDGLLLDATVVEVSVRKLMAADSEAVVLP